MAAKNDSKNQQKDGLSLSAQLLLGVDKIEKFAKRDVRGPTETLFIIEEVLKVARDKFKAQEYSKGLMAIFLVGQFSGPPSVYSGALKNINLKKKNENLKLPGMGRAILKELAHVIAADLWKNDVNRQIKIGEMTDLVIREIDTARTQIVVIWHTEADKHPFLHALEKAKIPLAKTMREWLKELPPPGYAQLPGRKPYESE